MITQSSISRSPWSISKMFHVEGLAEYDEKAFTDVGFSPFVRGRFTQIAQHEKTHVAFLSEALGDKSTKPCQCSFPHTEIKSVIALSQALEGVAYSGAARFITNRTTSLLLPAFLPQRLAMPAELHLRSASSQVGVATSMLPLAPTKSSPWQAPSSPHAPLRTLSFL